MTTYNNDVVILRSVDRVGVLSDSSKASTNFKITLPKNYSQVVQLSLLSAEIPNSFYQCYNSNGFLDGLVFVGLNNSVATSSIFYLPSGNYLIDDLCSLLLVFLQANFINSGIPLVSTVDYDTTTNKIFWVSSSRMCVYNNNSQLAQIFGIDPTMTGLPFTGGLAITPNSYTSVGSTSVNHFVINTDGSYTNYFMYPANPYQRPLILLKINEIGPNVFSTSSIQGHFRIQVKQNNYNSLIMVDTATNVSNVIDLQPTTFQSLSISLIALDGSIVDLNNNDWQFTLGIKYLS